jgi:hypothetical protein
MFVVVSLILSLLCDHVASQSVPKTLSRLSQFLPAFFAISGLEDVNVTQYKNLACPSPRGILSCDADGFIALNFDGLPANGSLSFTFFVAEFLRNVTAVDAEFTEFSPVSDMVTYVGDHALFRTLEVL